MLFSPILINIFLLKWMLSTRKEILLVNKLRIDSLNHRFSYRISIHVFYFSKQIPFVYVYSSHAAFNEIMSM